MFQDEFLLSFQTYIRKTLRLALFASIASFIFFSLLEWLKKGLVSNVFDTNLFFAIGLTSLILIVLDFSNQDPDRQRVGPLNNRERIWITLIAVSIGIFVWQKNIAYGWGTLPLSILTAIFSFFFLRALFEKPNSLNLDKKLNKKTTYTQIFNWLFLLSAVLILSVPVILSIKVVRRDISPAMAYHFDFQKPHPLFVNYNPKNVHGQVLPYAKIDNEILLQFKQDQAHFTVKLPDLCDKVKIKVTFEVEEMEEVNLKLPNFDQPKPLERFPLYNFLLSRLHWPYVASDTWGLYQRDSANHVYQTIDEFFENPPKNKKIGNFSHQELPFETLPLKDEKQMLELDYLITNYKPPEQKGLLFENEYEGQIPQKVLEGGIGAEYKFYIEAYGQKPNSKVSIKSIDLTFLRAPASINSAFNSLLRRLDLR